MYKQKMQNERVHFSKNKQYTASSKIDTTSTMTKETIEEGYNQYPLRYTPETWDPKRTFRINGAKVFAFNKNFIPTEGINEPPEIKYYHC